MGRNLKLSILGLVLVLSLGCATTKTSGDREVSFNRGKHVEDKIEPGAFIRNEYKVDVVKISKKYCWFRIEYFEIRAKIVTPLYEEIMKVRTYYYDPTTGEFLADIIGLPLRILINERPAGSKSDVQKNPTGRLIEGQPKIDGFIKVGPKPVSENIFDVSINDRFLKGYYKTDSDGMVKVPAKPIADYYLMKNRVRIDFGSEISVNLRESDLEMILKGVYGFE